MSTDKPHKNGESYNAGKVCTPEPKADCNYEKVIASTGYGLFNIFLLFAALPVAWTCIVDTTSTAFIINSTECIFELTMLKRGILLAAVFLGMTIAGLLWDFVLQDCITNRMGKRNILISGMLIEVTCNMLQLHATSFHEFTSLKFVSGLVIAGPLSVVMTFLSEFHDSKYQKNFGRWAGLLAAASIIMPAALAATLFLRTPWFHFTIYNNIYPTWRVYLLICASPSIFGLLMVCLLPESPKHLIARGKKREASQLLRAMYNLNNWRPVEEYSIPEFPSEIEQMSLSASCKNKLQESQAKLKELFSKHNLRTISTLLFLQCASMTGFHVMRLWVPPIWVMLNNFRVLVQKYYPKDELITMCEMIFPRIQKIDHTRCDYTLPDVESAVYINSTIIATSAVTFGFFFSLIATTQGKKLIVIMLMFFFSTIGCFTANWALKIPYMLVMVAIVIVGSRVVGNTILAYNIDKMPQHLRSTSASMLNVVGNFSGAVANVIFSVVLDFNCLAAFLGLGCVTLVCSLLPILLIEKERKNVETGMPEKYRKNDSEA
ncbi:hypothetical protein QAD02_015540 [Eretmocerus hayati]|uniref:Uncharacterized protein n=1 Tax=Eretmocerus hayati TaxID=131215 RepID=A0ACC2P9I8_9HYME|nr:hypothetical protein QAD02_015540 [Eretmocerus hayati]